MASLILYANGAPGIKYTVDRPIILIGRCERENDICLADSFVSKTHARIEARLCAGDDPMQHKLQYFLIDEGSRNHTYVNTKRVNACQLKDSDFIRIGRLSLKFVEDDSSAFEVDTMQIESDSLHILDEIKQELEELNHPQEMEEMSELAMLSAVEEIEIEDIAANAIQAQRFSRRLQLFDD